MDERERTDQDINTVAEQILSLPMYPELEHAHVQTVAEHIKARPGT